MTFTAPEHDDAERASLMAQIADARRRTAEAKRRTDEMSLALRAEVTASQQELEVIELQYASEIERVRGAAQSESTRIVNEARARASVEGVVTGVE